MIGIEPEVIVVCMLKVDCLVVGVLFQRTESDEGPLVVVEWSAHLGGDADSEWSSSSSEERFSMLRSWRF
jgi:hypothetical protein